MAVGANDARRLVRTESTYIANSAEMESYKECGITKYRFVATLDMRTSDICAALDGKEFDADKAMPGENMPPLHPFCRSTTVAVIDDAVMDGLKRRAKDPETGKYYEVPENLTYEQWKSELTVDSDSGIIRKKVASDGRYTWNQQKINELLSEDLKGIEFATKPVYNPKIRCNGKTTIALNKNNKVLYIEKIEIGKQDRSSVEFLTDTIIHEELEARIALKSNVSNKYKELFVAEDDIRHNYINKIIKKFFKMKGWWHDEG